MNKKQLWAKAYRDTAISYEKDMHETLTTKCSKCKLTVKLSVGNQFDSKCSLCPEITFDCYGLGCVERKIVPNNSNELHPLEKEALIEYHHRAADFIQNMNRFSIRKVGEYLVKLDNKLHRKYAKKQKQAEKREESEKLC